VGLLALAASVGHLGRPLYAWRAVIGLGHSWLSREIVAFGGFAGMAVVASSWRWVRPDSVIGPSLGAASTILGILGVACSILIYAVTGRRFWRLDQTARLFIGTTVVAGLGAVVTMLLASAASDGAGFSGLVRNLATSQAVAATVLLAGDALLLRPGGPSDPFLARAGRLLRGSLAGPATARFCAGAIGGIVLPAFLVVLSAQDEPDVRGSAIVSAIALALVVFSELAGRQIFFRAQTAPRMPGVPQ
jgi:DMSO reductase anchor subunit